MSKKKRKAKKLGAERGRDAGSPSDRRPTMSSETERPDDHRDPRDGTAAIPPVTDAMMDHAAHQAAALADGVAHGTAALEAAAGTDAAEAAGGATAAAVEAAQPLVQAAGDAVGAAAGAAERAAHAARDSAAASADAIGQYNAKVMEVLQTNMAAAGAHFAALVQAKSIPEAVSLNADHLRRQIETLTSQGRELSTLAQQAAFEAFRPLRDAVKRGR